ncbi:hypothetical protein MCO_01169, partial [Bartonella sp. DB5-6]
FLSRWLQWDLINVIEQAKEKRYNDAA